MTPPLNGLLLVGGKSRRMGRDKADLTIHGDESLRDRGLRLLGELTETAYLSIAADDTRSYSVPILRDIVPGKGPLGGIHTALQSAPDHAWLIVACDLTEMDAETLAHLVASRDPSAGATVFLSEIDGIAEPLCSIYEPSAAATLKAAFEADDLCARRFLRSLQLHSIPLPTAGALHNCNRPEDIEERRLQTTAGSIEKSVTLEFFAKLRDEAGCSTKPYTTRAATAAGLWDEVRLLHKHSMDLDTVRLAVNDEFADWSHPLADQDRLAFMPPFAGG